MSPHTSPSRRVRIVGAVSHERIDDEVIAIDLETGAYFAFDGPAAECWTLADAGGTAHDLGAALAAAFDVPVETATADADAFLAALVEHGLAVEEPASDLGTALGSPAPRDVRLPYETPIVEPFDDLETLLLIDPIHEVDDAGWPLPAADDRN